MGGTAAVNPDGYVHARTEQEYQRLRAQARLWEEATARVLDAVLAPGMACLDVGCGPGEAMRQMGARVGDTGRVVGLEIDGALGRTALAELRSRNGAHYDIIEGDATRIDAVVGAPFDLVFTRLTLMHMDDPVRLLTRMKVWARSGGVVAAQEYDFAALDVEPRFPEWSEFEAVFHGVFRAHGRDLRAGRHLPAQFAAAGLSELAGSEAAVKFEPLAAQQAMVLGVYDGLLPAALKLRITDESRAAGFRDAVRQAANARAYLLMPTLIAVWARLP